VIFDGLVPERVITLVAAATIFTVMFTLGLGIVVGEFRGVARVVIAVRNLEDAIKRYRQAYGLPAPIKQVDAAFGAQLALMGSGSVVLAPNATKETEVQHDAPSTKSTIYFPTLAITDTTGNGQSDVEASIVYRQSVGSSDINVFIRLVNHGSATAEVIWQVLIFAS